MEKSLNMVVEAESIMDELELKLAKSKEAGIFLKIVWNENVSRGTFEREGSRIEVAVTKIEEFFDKPRYIVSVPNYYYSFETENLRKVSYQMNDKTNWSSVDCESVQMAALHMKQLMDIYS